MKLIFDLWFYIMILFIINLMLILTQRVQNKITIHGFYIQESILKITWLVNNIYYKIYLTIL